MSEPYNFDKLKQQIRDTFQRFTSLKDIEKTLGLLGFHKWATGPTPIYEELWGIHKNLNIPQNIFVWMDVEPSVYNVRYMILEKTEEGVTK